MSPVKVMPLSFSALSSWSASFWSVLVSGKWCTARSRFIFCETDGSRLATAYTSTVAGTIFSTDVLGVRTSTRAAAAAAPTTTSPPAGMRRRRYRANHERVGGAAGRLPPTGSSAPPSALVGGSGNCPGVGSISWFIAGMPHSINSDDQVNLSAARARCRGVAEMQPGQGRHLIRGEPGAPASGVLPLHIAVDGDYARVIFAHLGRPV